jgi:hypothetical protein
LRESARSMLFRSDLDLSDPTHTRLPECLWRSLKGELGDAGFVEVAEAFVDHAVVFGATAAKTFVLSDSVSADGESRENVMA